MSTLRQHRCGGTLYPREVTVRSEDGGLAFEYRILGLVCDRCREELIDRDTAAQIEKQMTPAIWFTNQGLRVSSVTEPIRLNVPSISSRVAA